MVDLTLVKERLIRTKQSYAEKRFDKVQVDRYFYEAIVPELVKEIETLRQKLEDLSFGDYKEYE